MSPAMVGVSCQTERGCCTEEMAIQMSLVPELTKLNSNFLISLCYKLVIYTQVFARTLPHSAPPASVRTPATHSRLTFSLQSGKYGMKNNVYLHCMPTVYSDGRKNVSHHFNYTFLRFCSNTKYVPWRSIGWETLSLSVLQHTLWKLSDFHFFFIYYRMVTVA